jgi:hypothetical protein
VFINDEGAVPPSDSDKLIAFSVSFLLDFRFIVEYFELTPQEIAPKTIRANWEGAAD